MPRVYHSVHDSHCCVKHGCKYGNKDCPVVLEKEPGIICESCDEDALEYPYEIKRITGLSAEEFEALKNDALEYRRLKAEGKI